jgi:hypothetical protein
MVFAISNAFCGRAAVAGDRPGRGNLAASESAHRAAARSEFSWISLEQKAVWSEGRSVVFERTDPAKSPDRRLGQVVESGSGDAIRVEAVWLDDFAKARRRRTS